MSYHQLRALFAISALITVSLPRPVAAAISLEAATANWKRLEHDARAKKLRHHWERVIRDFDRVTKGKGGCAGALPRMRAARAAESLYEISRVRSDARSAERRYTEVHSLCPRGRLADDALLDAASLARRLGATERARAHLTLAASVAGDMRSKARGQLRRLPPAPRREARARLDEASEALKKVRRTPKLRRYSHHWTRAIRALERVGEALAPSKEAALAFMRAGKGAHDLSRISKRKAHAERAAALYLAVAEQCPGDSLVDDALLESAALETHRLGDIETARQLLKRAAALKGDAAKAARRQLRKLPRAPARVVARAPRSRVIARHKPSPTSPVDAFGLPPELETAAEAEADDLGSLMARIDDLANDDLLADVGDLTTRTMGSQISLSEQAGLKVRRIIIDAGHGGSDSGAVGPTGLQEKEVTLGISHKLHKQLISRGYEVLLTRHNDTFVALEDRTRFANARRGDLFISIHANAARNSKARGVETYTLNVASNRYSSRLAARENATTEASVGDLQFMLADLATRANTVDSSKLARAIQSRMVKGIRAGHGHVKNLGVKHALFYVLLGTRMPAVLVETSFISNRGEEKRLKSSKFQQTVATSIADGIDAFVAAREQIASAEF